MRLYLLARTSSAPIRCMNVKAWPDELTAGAEDFVGKCFDEVALGIGLVSTASTSSSLSSIDIGCLPVPLPLTAVLADVYIFQLHRPVLSPGYSRC